ncbi:MAG TPA: hypothetical protein VIL22_12215 [Paenibacillaceae bacterium]
MSAGYGAALLWLAALVLWWSGWRQELASDLPPRAVALFFALWPAGWLAGFLLPPGSRTAMAAAALPAVAFLAYRAAGPGRLAVWAAAALGAAVLLVATNPAVWLDGPLAVGPERSVPVLLGAVTALTLRTAREQLAVLSLVLPAAALAGMRLGSPPPGWPSPEYLPDMWWLAFAVCRAVSLALREMAPPLAARRDGRAGDRA